jgi:hypothetical protein
MLSYQVYEQDKKEPFEPNSYPDHLSHVLCESLSVLENLKQFNQPHSSDKPVELGDPGHPDKFGDPEIQEYQFQGQYCDEIDYEPVLQIIHSDFLNSL